MPELVGENQFRLLQNTRTVSRGKLCRINGWQKFLSGFITNRAYNNEDGKNQLLDLQGFYAPLDEVDGSGVVVFPPDNADFGDFCGTTFVPYDHERQPYTFLAEVTSTANTRTLLRATQSRLYEVLVGKGTQRILCDGLGGIDENAAIRLRHSQTGNFVLFTNNYNAPFYWRIGAGASGCAMNSTKEIPELAEIGLTKSLVTFEFRGLLFLCNNEEDGVRKANMVRWAGANPTNWVEETGFSLAGHYELDYGDEVLAAGKMGDYAYLYTTRGIWQVSVHPDPDVMFTFTKIHTSVEGEGCIAYPFSFTTTGRKHYYMAKDGIYSFSQSYPDPIREEWIHDASNIIYDDINEEACMLHTAGFDPVSKTLYFSAVQGSDELPSVTLSANTEFGQCSKLDFGATAFLSCAPSNTQTWRDWLIDNCICSEEELDSEELRAIGFATVKEGDGKPKTDPPCTTYPDSIYTTETATFDGFEMEDFEQEEASPTSICNAFPEQTLADLCLGCPGPTIFTFAHATDWTIKQMTETASREMYDETTDAYSFSGYTTRFLKGPMMFGSSDPKTMEHVSLEFSCGVELSPPSMVLRVGKSVRSEDPIDAEACGIEWQTDASKLIKCVNNDRRMEWPVYVREECLYLDFTIAGIGGLSCYSSLEVRVREDGRHP